MGLNFVGFQLELVSISTERRDSVNLSLGDDVLYELSVHSWNNGLNFRGGSYTCELNCSLIESLELESFDIVAVRMPVVVEEGVGVIS